MNTSFNMNHKYFVIYKSEHLHHMQRIFKLHNIEKDLLN